jgi:hypothetical protein
MVSLSTATQNRSPDHIHMRHVSYQSRASQERDTLFLRTSSQDLPYGEVVIHLSDLLVKRQNFY